MFLTRILLHDFKNIADAEVEFSPKVNYIYGSNGAGKTNLLDAIYYLTFCFPIAQNHPCILKVIQFTGFLQYF